MGPKLELITNSNLALDLTDQEMVVVASLDVLDAKLDKLEALLLKISKKLGIEHE